MRLLLDTHVVLWSQAEPERLGGVGAALEDTANELLVSAASAWEIAIKAGSGRLVLPEPPEVWLPSRLKALGALAVAIEHRDALAVATLPRLHGDPFDRILVVQARRLGATLVTGDRAVLAYDGQMLAVP